jgi:hypothetical protein
MHATMRAERVALVASYAAGARMGHRRSTDRDAHRRRDGGSGLLQVEGLRDHAVTADAKALHGLDRRADDVGEADHGGRGLDGGADDCLFLEVVHGAGAKGIAVG